MTGPGNDDEPDDRRDPRSPEDEAPGTDEPRPEEDTPGTDDPAAPADGWEWVGDDSADDETPMTGEDGATSETGAGESGAGESDADGGDDPVSNASNSTNGAADSASNVDRPVDENGTDQPRERLVGNHAADSAPAPQSGEDESYDGALDWFLHTDNTAVQTVRDIGSSLLTVAVLGLVLFAISGVWPPLVAVESGSMEPHMYRNDLVFIVDEHRYAGDSAFEDTGVVTHQTAQQTDGYWSFGNYGNVIVYQPFGSDRQTPIIHRAMFHVDAGENWVDPESEGGTGKANVDYLYRAGERRADHDECSEVQACPAQHAGFITKGDANPEYDQVGGQSNVVRPEWIRGKAKVRIPWLGWVRLKFAQAQAATAIGAGTGPMVAGLRLSLGLTVAGVGAVVSQRNGWL
ncbi:S26 family signal peptidase [Haloarchaeobius sp. TZWWS8]|uniref:S26 family signal peptidase n=1 Tax=Haloarchaeobius sp. TZWWS8 TaxID=3446121 RepID=UPI003EBF6523